MSCTKEQIRKQMLSMRNKYVNRDAANEIILRKLIDICSEYTRIFTYISYGSEVDTHHFIENELKNNKEIFVPVCDIRSSTMISSKILDMKDLVKNSYGIPEPQQITDCNANCDVIVFPGAAFDVYGHRIGYGKGYYDKYLANLKIKPLCVGLCYDFQLVDSIPNEKHDVTMDVIITENRVVYI